MNHQPTLGATFTQKIDELRNPDCLPERWYELALEYPIQAMSSPLYNLLLLEDPGRWLEFEATNARRWIHEREHSISEETWRGLGADYVERVLPIFKEMHPTDWTIEHAIRTARDFATGKANQENLKTSHGYIQDTIKRLRIEYSDESESPRTDRPIASAAMILVSRARNRMKMDFENTYSGHINLHGHAFTPLDRIRPERCIPEIYVIASLTRHIYDDATAKTECVWQWRRMAHYLQRPQYSRSSWDSGLLSLLRPRILGKRGKRG